jgi:hypothetical protein
MSPLVEQSDDVGSNPLSWLYGKTEACEHEPPHHLEVGMLLAHELVHRYHIVVGLHDGRGRIRTRAGGRFGAIVL